LKIGKKEGETKSVDKHWLPSHNSTCVFNLSYIWF